MKKYCFLILVPFLLSGCGYKVGSLLPKDIKTISVPTITNNTMEPGIELPITNAVIKRFRVDGTLRVVKEKDADLLLEGKLVEYSREPLRYKGKDFNKVREYRLKLRAKLTLTDLRTGKSVWEEPVYVTGETSYFLEGDLQTDEMTAFGLPYQEAKLPTLDEDFARKVVDAVVEGGW